MNTSEQIENNSELPSIKQLQWQCRRGMLELDVVLIPFLNNHFESLTVYQKEIFVALLKEADPDLFTWIMGFGKCESVEFCNLINIIRDKMSVA